MANTHCEQKDGGFVSIKKRIKVASLQMLYTIELGKHYLRKFQCFSLLKTSEEIYSIEINDLT